MQPVDSSARPVASIEQTAAPAPVASARQEAFQRAAQQLLGRQIQGDIVGRLNDGGFLVRIAGADVRMMLPAGLKVGDSLAMKLLAASPKATFLLESATTGRLGNPGQSGGQHGFLLDAEAVLPDLSAALRDSQGSDTPARSGSIAPQARTAAAPVDAAKTPGPGQTPADPQSSPDPHTFFSPAGRLIGAVIHAAQQQHAPAALVGKTPVLASPDAKPDHIASSLQDTLANSGLFYESHIVEWADGKRELVELMREPQAALLRVGDGDASAQTPPGGAQAALSPELAQLINLQLDALEHSRTRWAGEIWPGQKMQWSVARQEESDSQARDKQQQSWSSSVQFNLPGLGRIDATVHLLGERVHIHVNTPSQQVASTLRSHAPLLADALGAAGSPLDSLIVKHEHAR